MAKSKGGPPRVGDLSTRILISIRDGIQTLAERMGSGFDAVNERLTGVNDRLDQTNDRLDQTNERLDQTNARLDQTVSKLDQTVSKLDQTLSRLDNLRDIAGEKYRELDARIRVLEARLLAP